MPIDMRGFKVFYKSQIYICLRIEPYTSTEYVGDLKLVDAEKLRVTVINQYEKIQVLDDFLDRFDFFKDSKNA